MRPGMSAAHPEPNQVDRSASAAIWSGDCCVPTAATTRSKIGPFSSAVIVSVTTVTATRFAIVRGCGTVQPMLRAAHRALARTTRVPRAAAPKTGRVTDVSSATPMKRE